MSLASEKTMQDTFRQIEAAAIIGARCPLNDVAVNKHAIYALAQRGYIKVEIYAKNWRVIEILTGPHQGKRTAPPPHAGALYRILDADGTSWRGPAAQRRLRTSLQRIAP